jgi:hypothetical protein
MTLPVPNPTPIVRIMHVDNLAICLQRQGIHAPTCQPDDGLVYRPIHSAEIQAKRRLRPVTCGPRGVIHDYVPFYFGHLSPMLFQLKTGRVHGYTDGQDPIIHVVSCVQAVQAAGAGFIFSDGHGLAAYTSWYDDLAELSKVDWTMVYQRYWRDEDADMDRQRRKQAEFLVHRFVDWSLITEVVVISEAMRQRVQTVMAGFLPGLRRPVTARRDWYY